MTMKSKQRNLKMYQPQNVRNSALKRLWSSNLYHPWCIFSVIVLLAVHFTQWSFHISFPEFATIPIMRLKKFNERSIIEGLKRVVKRFVEQVELNIEFVQIKRDEAAFSPNDQQSIETFLQVEKRNKTASYTQYYQGIIDKALVGTKEKKLCKYGNNYSRVWCCNSTATLLMVLPVFLLQF